MFDLNLLAFQDIFYFIRFGQELIVVILELSGVVFQGLDQDLLLAILIVNELHDLFELIDIINFILKGNSQRNRAVEFRFGFIIFYLVTVINQLFYFDLVR